MLKFLRHDHRFTCIASGSLLGVTLAQTTSIPIGSILYGNNIRAILEDERSINLGSVYDPRFFISISPHSDPPHAG